MTREQWKNRVKCYNLPIMLCIANHEIPLESVSYIGEVCINTKLVAGFDIYMKDGTKLEFYYDKYKLKPMYETKTKLLFFKQLVQVTDIQKYFKRDCLTLQEVYKINDNCNRVLMKFNRFKLKGYIYGN